LSADPARPDGASGHQLITPVGRLDILCIDTSTNALVVVELKRGRSADRVVGQVARCMGWARAHLAATGQGVEGIVVAREHDDRLRYAAAAVPGLTILTYRVTFHLEPVPGIALLPGLLCIVGHRCPRVTLRCRDSERQRGRLHSRTAAMRDWRLPGLRQVKSADQAIYVRASAPAGGG
jgi:hypothetical protein